MKTATSRRRKPATSATSKIVKASINLDADTHRRLIVAASLSGRKRDDIVLDAIRDACAWVVISDRRKTDDSNDRPKEESTVSTPEEIAA